ncbi:MAG TPA: DUF2344 domain-containing protein [Candidatus Limnocylindrales bacterium]
MDVASDAGRTPQIRSRPNAAEPGAKDAAGARQRWRITYERDPVAPERVGRAALDEWGDTFERSRLWPARMPTDPGRVRLAFAAPLAANATGCRELVDVWLLERVARWKLREAIASTLPADHRWVDAEDVWLGDPPLPGQVVAATWRVTVTSDAPGPVDRDRLRRAIDETLAAASIERVRTRGGTTRRYDLRPLLGRVELLPGDPLELVMRTRFDPERGAGRPEEVIAAIADAAGAPLEVDSLIRTGLILARDAAA